MKFIAYYRVSTRKQGISGLGLEAQRQIVLDYIKNNGNQLVAEYTEVESGTHDHRPQLTKAIAAAQQQEATLVIARLDRLSRNLAFITRLMEAKVRFVACDLPEATEFTVHLMAALAQQQQKYISDRTKEGLAAKRRRDPDWRPGTNNLTKEAVEKAHRTISRNARTDRRVRWAYHFIKPLREAGLSYQAIADKLNAEGYPTRRGKAFNKMTVWEIWKRFEDERQ